MVTLYNMTAWPGAELDYRIEWHNAAIKKMLAELELMVIEKQRREVDER